MSSPNFSQSLSQSFRPKSDADSPNNSSDDSNNNYQFLRNQQQKLHKNQQSDAFYSQLDSNDIQSQGNANTNTEIMSTQVTTPSNPSSSLPSLPSLSNSSSQSFSLSPSSFISSTNLSNNNPSMFWKVTLYLMIVVIFIVVILLFIGFCYTMSRLMEIKEKLGIINKKVQFFRNKMKKNIEDRIKHDDKNEDDKIKKDYPNINSDEIEDAWHQIMKEKSRYIEKERKSIHDNYIPFVSEMLALFLFLFAADNYYHHQKSFYEQNEDDSEYAGFYN